MKLLKTQQNELFDIIINVGMNPLDFAIRGKKIASRLEDYRTTVIFKPADYYFTFELDTVSFSPATERISFTLVAEDWGFAKRAFIEWLQCLKREIAAPDKWAELLQASEEITWKVEEGDNSQFTEKQLSEIEASINQIKTRFVSLNLLPQQLTLIYERLDYINEKATAIGKLDWKNLAMGALLALMIQLALPPDTSKAVWTLFKQVFQPLLLIQLP